MKLCTYQPLDSELKNLTDNKEGFIGVVNPWNEEFIIDAKELFLQGRESLVLATSLDLKINECEDLPYSLSSMQALLNEWENSFELLKRLLVSFKDKVAKIEIPVESVRLLPPLATPASMRDCMSYEAHFLQSRRGGAKFLYPRVEKADKLSRKFLNFDIIRTPKSFYELPVYYKGNTKSVVGHGDDVVWPNYCKHFDYELEIGLFISKKGKNISIQDAWSYIAGFTLFNDFSARCIQLKEMKLGLGPSKGKDFDTGNSIGPYIVTTDEIPDISNLKATAYVNGELWTETSTQNPVFSVRQIISHISQCETLYPGDFIGLGTLPNGCGLEHGKWLKPGDVIEIKAEHLGALKNQIIILDKTSEEL